MRRLTLAVLGLALLVTACGGGGPVATPKDSWLAYPQRTWKRAYALSLDRRTSPEGLDRAARLRRDRPASAFEDRVVPAPLGPAPLE